MCAKYWKSILTVEKVWEMREGIKSWKSLKKLSKCWENVLNIGKA